jgi:hypothetical protein
MTRFCTLLEPKILGVSNRFIRKTEKKNYASYIFASGLSIFVVTKIDRRRQSCVVIRGQFLTYTVSLRFS